MPARKILEKSFDELTLIPISEAAERWFCSVRTIERLQLKGAVDIYGLGAERVCDRDMGDTYFLRSKRPTLLELEAKKKASRKGRKRIR